MRLIAINHFEALIYTHTHTHTDHPRAGFVTSFACNGGLYRCLFLNVYFFKQEPSWFCLVHPKMGLALNRVTWTSV